MGVQIPPKSENRTFNVHDILGDHDRDDKGNIIVNQDQSGNFVDNNGKMTNQRGYL